MRRDQKQIVDQLPVHRGLQKLGVNGRSSDLSGFLKPSHSDPGRDTTNSGLHSETNYGFTAAGTVTDSNGIPFSFHRQSRLAETNDYNKSKK